MAGLVVTKFLRPALTLTWYLMCICNMLDPLTRVVYPLNMKQRIENEAPRERFKRLATLRTNVILQRLKVLGNCSNKQIYEYDEVDIEKIFSEIERKVREAKSKFHFTKKQDRFRL